MKLSNNTLIHFNFCTKKINTAFQSNLNYPNTIKIWFRGDLSSVFKISIGNIKLFKIIWCVCPDYFLVLPVPTPDKLQLLKNRLHPHNDPCRKCQIIFPRNGCCAA